MNSKTIKAIKKIQKIATVKTQTAYTGQFQMRGEKLVLEFPKSVLNHLKFPNGQVCWTIINNTIQLSPKKLSFFIPAIELSAEEFEPHKKN